MVAQIKMAYKWVQALSLDVVLGSGLLNLAIARYYGADLPLVVVLGLMIAVWCIYTIDHLSDAKGVKKQASTYRHRFHQQHFKSLCIVLVFIAMVGIAMLQAMPLIVVKWGFGCVLFMALYFILIRFHAFWPKELLIAFGYTCGVFLGPITLATASLTLFHYILIPQIFLLALANLLIFSCFDLESDKQDGHYSLAIHLGVRTSQKLTLCLIASGLLLSALLIYAARLMITQDIQLLIIIMNLLLLMLLLRKDSFRQHELYRVIGDGIFFIPALILLYGS